MAIALSSFRAAACAATVILLLGSCATQTSDPSVVLRRASQAMGADTLKTLRYNGDGVGWTNRRQCAS